MKPYGSKRSFDTEPRMKAGRALVKREGEEEIKAHDPAFNRNAYESMMVEERSYLIANGWEPDMPFGDLWSCPTIGREGLAQGHAVNVQKQIDRQYYG